MMDQKFNDWSIQFVEKYKRNMDIFCLKQKYGQIIDNNNISFLYSSFPI